MSVNKLDGEELDRIEQMEGSDFELAVLGAAPALIAAARDSIRYRQALERVREHLKAGKDVTALDVISRALHPRPPRAALTPEASHD